MCFMDIITPTFQKILTSETTFSKIYFNLLSILKTPKIYGMERITTEEVMDKLDMFLASFGKIDKFGCWDLEIIPADACTQFTSTEF